MDDGMPQRCDMENKDFNSIVAGILPPLLGLGLIELYIERNVSIGVVAAGLIALAILMIVISALVDVADASETTRRRPSRP